MTPSLTLLDTSLGLVGAYLLKRVLEKQNPAPLPPGPRGVPVLGNLLQWPSEKEWETYGRWADEHGDIVHVDLAGSHAIILNSAELAEEMFESKGSLYSNRPHFHFANDIVGWGPALMVLPYNDRLKEMRRLFGKTIGTKASLIPYAHVQEAESARFLRCVLDEPEKLAHHVRKLAGAIVLQVSHGYQVKDGRDDFVDFAEKLMSEFAYATSPGNFVVDAIPALDYLPDWFPGTGYRAIAARLAKTRVEFLNLPHERVKAQLAAGTARPSFVASNVDRADLTPEQDDIVKWAAAAMYGGGADTTAGSIYNFVLCMVLFPDVQRRAQAEIDAVIGGDRLPTVADRADLPYLEAVIKEVLRWGQVVPSGVPHASAEDDVHRGYFIPKGSIIIPNIWRFTHDERTYAAPNAFNPDRFLGATPEQDPRAYVFGFGRRVCPGQQLAEHTTFIACATILAALTLSKAQDPLTGTELTPTPEWEGVVVTHLKEFPCVAKPRSAKAEALVRASAAAASST